MQQTTVGDGGSNYCHELEDLQPCTDQNDIRQYEDLDLFVVLCRVQQPGFV